MASMRREATARQLVIYVSSHCDNCHEAHRMAELAAVQCPNIHVRIVDLDMDPDPLPDYVVAVPTYVMDGRVIALGNPYADELIAYLGSAV
jgi:alkyl hydroperoxide reductase subunit AhpF